jgi:anti-sigma B factor antagonist
MSNSALQIVERHAGDVVVLTLSGEITLDDGDLAFGRWIDDLGARGVVKIIVDLAAVTYIDSAGIGMMAAMLKDVRKRGGDIRILRLNTQGQRLFGVLKLKTTFEVFNDEAAALRSFEFRPRG